LIRGLPLQALRAFLCPLCFSMPVAPAERTGGHAKDGAGLLPMSSMYWSLVQQTVSSRTCMLPVEKSFVMGNCLALISKRRRKNY
jgi:hypothetical protein